MKLLENILSSGQKFNETEIELKTRYEVANIFLLFSISGLLFGISGNIIRELHGYIAIELLIVLSNLVMMYLLRVSRSFISIVAEIFSFEYSFFTVFLIYMSSVEDMKHLWLYAYPLILLSLQPQNRAKYWLLVVFVLLAIAPFQSFIEIQFTPYQILYILVVYAVISFISYFFQMKMHEANVTIYEQRLSLERRVNELSKKDSMLTAQSKQAVMGEMMSMIAHQWRQPLSTVTLNISNLQFKKMLGQEISDELFDKALNEISDTVVYLSDTVDDFQTFFHPKKEKTQIEIHELLQRAVNFVAPRTKEHKIEISINKYIEIKVITYVNELIQMILNILNNAIDALEDAKKEKAKIIIYVELKGEHIYISIVDNANGISPDDVDKIFDPYFSTKGKNGTGLGLYMSQMLAQKQFDGDITFTSSHLGTHFLVKVKKDISS